MSFVYVLTNFTTGAAVAAHLQHVAAVGVFMEASSILTSCLALAGVAAVSNHTL